MSATRNLLHGIFLTVAVGVIIFDFFYLRSKKVPAGPLVALVAGGFVIGISLMVFVSGE